MTAPTRDEFVDTYRRLRARRVTRDRIRTQLGLTVDAFGQRYRRAVAAGLLTPDTDLYRRGGRVEPCACCRRHLRIQGRGICAGCWQRHRAAGTLHEHPRATRDGRDFAEDYTTLRAQMLTRRQIAERLGMTPAAVQKAYSRALRRGLVEPDSAVYRRHVFDTTRVYQHTRWDTAA